MTELSGYVFSALRGGEFTLYRGSGDGLDPILLLAPIGEYFARESLKRLEHEHDLKAELDADWAVRPVDLSRHDGRMALVLEDPGGEPLDQLIGQPMDVTQFLHIAIPLAAAIGQMHRHVLIHKDIKPANILVDVASGGVWLTGFGIASRLPRERQAPAPPEIIAGTLAYMAPEQTGRMNRSIDARSDLYSLGITFYEMLTGTLPFTAADSMAWVHCHIARQPPPPEERVAGIPGPLAAIVMKLLAKTAEERYQTATGVEADLRQCLVEWEAHRRIDPFPLGAHDVSDRLLIPEKLYGREREIASLLAAFDRVVVDGTTELVLVSGYSGIGKTSVVNELHRMLVPSRGLFAPGKFDQYKRDIPYATLAQAFQNLVRPLLGQSEAELGCWRDALREALGPNGQLMVDLVPQLELVIGTQPPVPDLPPRDAQYRFQMVFRRFLGVFAKPEHPLALFLDDLQWLDTATLDLIEHLVTHPEVRHLLLVGAYRDNEVGPSHPLSLRLKTIREAGMDVQEIQLAPLMPDDLERLLAEALHTSPGRVRPLADLVFEKTDGNPFFTIQFLIALEEVLLAFDPGTEAWTWDLARIRAKGFTDNVADLMAGKLRRFSSTTQEALKQLACLGNVAPTATLALVHGTTEEAMHTALWEAVHAGLVIRSDSTYTFLHDRIQEAAYALIAEGERTMAHLRIGRLLAARTTSEELEDRIFDIVNQFDRGAALITTPEEREQVAELNLMAGKRAKAATAYASALQYFTAGRALLTRNEWERCYRLTFNLELNLAECEYLTGELASADERLSALSQRAQTTVDAAAVACVRLNLYTHLDQSDSAVQVGVEYLQRGDGLWSRHPTAQDVDQHYDRLWQQIGSSPIEALVALPAMADPDQCATMDVLTALASPALFTDLNLFRLVVCRMAALSLENGNSDGSCYAYVWLGGVLGTYFGNYQAGFRFGRLGLDLVEKRGLDRHSARVYLVFAVHVAPWLQDLPTCRVFLRRAFEAAQHDGDLTYAAYSCADLITNRLASGDPLDDVEREAGDALQFVRKMRFGLISDLITTQLRLIRMLCGLTPDFTSFNDAEFDEVSFEQHLESNPQLAIAASRYWIRKLQACVYSGDSASGLVAALKTAPLLWTVPSQVELSEYYFYAALARAAHCDTASAEERPLHLDAAAAHHRQITLWAENCPSTFANRAALVGAEIARLEGRELDAERLYEQAVRSAHEHGFIQNEGLACELAARFYAGRGFEQIAQLYLRNARRCYLSWGAEGKVRQLEQLHPHLREGPAPPPPTTTIGALVEQLDVGTVVKASQAVSGEIELGKLIETLMKIAIEHAGAERGLLILPRGDESRVVAEATAGRGKVEVTVRETAVSPVALPQSALHYVMRTRESVVLDDASVRNLYSDDEYIRQKQPRSVLCLPVVKQTKLVGALYLENNLTPYAFTSSRVAVLELLASQAAISLENARLYRDLAEREAKIRRLVDANIIGIFLWDFDGRILEANDAFLRMVGYDREDLIAGRIRRADLTPPDWYERDEQWVEEHRRTGLRRPIEKEFLRKDGSRVPILLGAATFEEGGNQGVAFVLDLTDRKRAEVELRESEQNYRMLFESMDEGFCTIEVLFDQNEEPVDYRFLQINPSFERQTGIKNAAGRRMREIAPQHEEHWFEIYGRIALTGEPMRFENEAKQLGRWYDVYAFPVEDPKRRRVGILFNDITERKRAETEARESEQRFRDYAEIASDWLWETGPDHRFIHVSEQLTAVGISPAHRIGLRRWDFATDVDEEPEKWRLHIATLEAHQPFRGFVFRVKADDGSAHYITASGKPVFDPEGRFLGYRGVGSDVTAAVRAEQAEEALHKTQMELAHVARVTTLGELAASIAHEVNQPLAAIVTNGEVGLQWLDRETPNLAEVREALGDMINNGRRASEIIQRLRALSRKAETQKVALDINAVIREVIPLVHQEVLSHRVSLRLELTPTLPPLLGDRIQLQQVIINLIVNGMEAMAPITDRPRDLVVRSQLDDSGQVLVAVQDSGVGIDPERAKQLFNAFFTTKSTGMGMGLSICRSIIENHGGRLWASPNAEPGTTFQFVLPSHSEVRS
ncbi:AAA family ATPase [Mesorhizobium escarrei]|uniref:histidine kinase n=1 Tax=Mesorhizobium escarrei TaxID=666018 RepID=A0ABM9EAC2_9HYPH|nr:AAA family ATPase [Mesorhizobium escarrei]CAH2405775.1 PAS domain S-box-containing protein [Mesorhizobium escarrei]